MAPPEVSRDQLRLLQRAHRANGSTLVLTSECAAASALQEANLGVFIDHEYFCIKAAGVAIAISHPSAEAA